MCGIAGWYGLVPSNGQQPTMQRMLQAIVHRGPDDDGTFFEPGVGLGMRRLSIIDLATGHQPMSNEDGTVWTVFNGEIYNYHELRKDLLSRGHQFRTKCDTEVIVHGFEEWGDAFLEKLNGMFGLALWDSRRRRLLLARDPFGVKPLYYRLTADGLFFASEIKPLLAADKLRPSVDSEALDLYLTFRFVPSPRTMFEGVFKLRPGHKLTSCDAGVQVERFAPATPRLEVVRSERAGIEAVRCALEAAVRRQMLSDVPIGALLSGGVDSATVVALMTKHTGERVRTFTIGFADGGSANELDDARATAKYFGTEHHELVLSNLDFQRMFDDVVRALEEPIATPSTLPLHVVCALARSHVKVVLTGQGADEPAAGYHRYLGERYGWMYRSVPSSVRSRLISPIVETLPRQERLKRAVRSLGIVDPAERFTNVYSLFPEELKRALTGRPSAEDRATEVVQYWRHGIENRNSMVQMAWVDARLSLADDLLICADKMSMACGIEARVPFLDLEYMNLAENLPSDVRIRGLRRKYILKKACSRWIPDFILRRPKRGFDTPIDSWFRSEVSSAVRETLLASNSICDLLFDRRTIGQMLDHHRTGRQDYRRQLFGLWILEKWHATFVRSDVTAHRRSVSALPLPVETTRST